MFELYRPEAVEYARVVRLGDISSAVPYRGWRMWAFLVAAFLSLLALLLLIKVPRQQIISGSVRTEGASVRIDSKGNWLVENVFVRNGERVRENQPLFTASEIVGSLADTHVRGLMLDSSVAQQTALQQQLATTTTLYRSQARELAKKISSKSEARRRLHAQASLQEARSRIAQQSLVDVGELLRKGFVSRLEYQRRQDNAIAAQQQEIGLKQQEDLLRAAIADDELALTQLAGENATALARLRGQLSEAEANRAQLAGASHFFVRAPADGVLGDWSLEPNTTMQPNALAGVLLAEPIHLIGEVFVPTSASGFLRSGQPVLLDYDGFPAAQFGFGRATIVSISNVPVSSQDTSNGPGAIPGYRVILKLAAFRPRTSGKEWAFRPGMKFRAHFVLNRVALWRTLLAPIIGTER